jgi:acetyl esterase
MASDLHAQAQRLLASFADAGGKPFAESTVEEARLAAQAMTSISGAGPEMAAVEDRRIDSNGASIEARVYVPSPEPPSATVVWFHGGGWVVGGLDTTDIVCRALADASGARVVSVDYRHAPEHRFPVAASDAIAAVRWAADNVAGDTPLVVAGESSGGNLAAVASQQARALGGPEPALQVLFYPVTDCDFGRPSYVEHADAVPIGRADMEWFWDHYAPAPEDRVSPLASPLCGELSGLPPALVVVAGHDPLFDEGVAYAEALAASGVDVTLRRYDDMPHGFVSFVNVLDRASEAIDDAARAIRSVMARA